MTTKHTLGPWRAEHERLVIGGNDREVAHTIVGLFDDEQAANAARIVACVNACERFGDRDPAEAIAALVDSLESVVDGLSSPDVLAQAVMAEFGLRSMDRVDVAKHAIAFAATSAVRCLSILGVHACPECSAREMENRPHKKPCGTCGKKPESI